ncbi:MAG: hypothetical protein ACXW25_02855 [Rhodospirillales bacterium]
MNPRAEDHFDLSHTDPGFELTLGAESRPASPADDDKPFNMSMYLDFLPGTD